MLNSLSRTRRIFVVGAAALCLATSAAAQATQTKETVAAGPASVKTIQVQGELVAKGSNWLIAKDPAGYYRLYNVQPGRKAIIDGVSKTLDQLQIGTMLTSTATTTETPLVNRTTTITKGTVFWASPKSVIVSFESGDNKQYNVPDDFKFDVDGKKLSAMELKPGHEAHLDEDRRGAGEHDHEGRRRDGHRSQVGGGHTQGPSAAPSGSLPAGGRSADQSGTDQRRATCFEPSAGRGGASSSLA